MLLICCQICSKRKIRLLFLRNHNIVALFCGLCFLAGIYPMRCSTYCSSHHCGCQNYRQNLFTIFIFHCFLSFSQFYSKIYSISKVFPLLCTFAFAPQITGIIGDKCPISRSMITGTSYSARSPRTAS